MGWPGPPMAVRSGLPVEEPSKEPAVADALRLLKAHVESAERLDAGEVQEEIPAGLREMLERLGYVN